MRSLECCALAEVGAGCNACVSELQSLPLEKIMAAQFSSVGQTPWFFQEIIDGFAPDCSTRRGVATRILSIPTPRRFPRTIPVIVGNNRTRE